MELFVGISGCFVLGVIFCCCTPHKESENTPCNLTSINIETNVETNVETIHNILPSYIDVIPDTPPPSYTVKSS